MAKQNINQYEDSKFQATNAITSEFLNLFYESFWSILSDKLVNTKIYSTESKENR